eukprot:Hpha_TRINITY_DN15031_c0_g3::TRINITY_DN15031_c0_g3_i1::g.123516::m.123516
MPKEFSWEEVEKHTSEDDCWLVMTNKGEHNVYDVTKYLDKHPGGASLLHDLAGHDATQDFNDVGHPKSAMDEREKYLIGKLNAEAVSQISAHRKSGGGGGSSESSGGGGGGMKLALLVVIIAIVYYYLQQQKKATGA